MSYTETLQATKKFEQKLKDAFYHSKLFSNFRLQGFRMEGDHLIANIREVNPCRCSYSCNDNYYTFKFPMSAIEEAFKKDGVIYMDPLKPYLIKKNDEDEESDD